MLKNHCQMKPLELAIEFSQCIPNITSEKIPRKDCYFVNSTSILIFHIRANDSDCVEYTRKIIFLIFNLILNILIN